jgi:hypothetical protein
MKEKNTCDYLGDGVYIEFDGYAFWLRANDHRDNYCTDKIYLEPSVINALNRFVERVNNEK